MPGSSHASRRRLSLLFLPVWMAALALPCFAAVSAPAPTADRSFVASLAAAPAATAAPAPSPAPTFLAGASCTTNWQCPQGQLCCPACAVPGCTVMKCLPSMNGCPLVP